MLVEIGHVEAIFQEDEWVGVVLCRWGEQVSMYWDLELFDAEVFTVISVRQLQRLALVLEISVKALLFGEEPAATMPAVRYRDVVARLEVCMAEDGVSIDELGDLPVAGLWSVCRAAKMDWVGVINTREPA